MVLTQTIISKQYIKPSVSTPNRFKTHALSSLDQFAPINLPVQSVFFYKKDESKSNIEISQLLKQSLSQVLSIFYPFSGIIKENSFVDCNDTGVEFVEAQIHTQLAQVIHEPKIEDLKQLAPIDNFEHGNNAILLVKVNFFDCGGIAICATLSHKVVDYSSYIVFMNAWASISSMSRDETHINIIQPLFDLARHFPPRNPATLSNVYPQEENQNTKLKIFVFDKENLEMLQRQTSSTKVKNPTKVEALTVFLVQQFIEATKAVLGENKTSYVVHHVINLRSRTSPPIPDQTIGNCITTFDAVISDTINGSDLIYKLRVGKDSIDGKFINEVIKTEEYVKTPHNKTGVEYLLFSSIWRYPVYEIDFGWGKPTWVSSALTMFKNMVIFSTTSSQDGIEAWISAAEDVLHIIEINYNEYFKVQ